MIIYAVRFIRCPGCGKIHITNGRRFGSMIECSACFTVFNALTGAPLCIDDGLGDHCSCCAHRRGVGDHPCGGPACPCLRAM